MPKMTRSGRGSGVNVLPTRTLFGRMSVRHTKLSRRNGLPLIGNSIPCSGKAKARRP